MERRRKNSERVHKFYAAKDEEEDSDSDEEEDEVLDFHKQKSEVIFWNDPRIRFNHISFNSYLLFVLVEQNDQKRFAFVNTGQIIWYHDYHCRGK